MILVIHCCSREALGALNGDILTGCCNDPSCGIYELHSRYGTHCSAIDPPERSPFAGSWHHDDPCWP